MKTVSADVLVIGGGIVGLSSALAMALEGFSVTLIDAGPLAVKVSEVCESRVYAINKASQTFLQRLEVWQQIDPTRLSPFRQIHVWDGVNKAILDFDARLVAAAELGTIVEEAILRQALLNEIKKQPKISLFPHTKVEALEETADWIRVKACDSQTWQAELLMIADGANSPCRELLKVPMTRWSYHQQALVALIHTEKNHQQKAYQVFNPEATLAFLPLSAGHLSSIVWSTSPKEAKRLMSLSKEEFNQELASAFEQKLGLTTLEGERQCFPLSMRHVHEYSGSRWLLLGDAAHTIHPLAGLGLNIGLADVETWLACLQKVNKQLISSRALKAYQRQRKAALWQVIVMMEGLKTLFTNSLPPIISLRGLGLKLCNHLPPLKRFFIAQAMGRDGQ